MKPFLRNLGRGALATFVFALSFGTVFSATTGTSRTQQALLELFCDACGQPQNVNIRDLAASTVTLLDAQTITGAKTFSGGVSGTGVPNKLGQWGVPCGLAPSGTMANNGAVTLGTALPLTYDGGIWLYYPAGAVAAGVPAAPGLLWTVMSSTTVGTVYNSTFDGLSVPVVGTTTAYATTGPGAFTGVITTEFACGAVTVPANSLGANGQILIDFALNNNTAANNKNFRVRLGGLAGTQMAILGMSTAVGGIGRAVIANAGVTNRQKGTAWAMHNTNGLVASAPASASIDTTASTTVVLSMAVLTTATNYGIVESASIFLVQ